MGNGSDRTSTGLLRHGQLHIQFHLISKMGDHDAPAALAPEGATAVVEDGGVKMLIVKEGTGELPPMHSRCLGEYLNHKITEVVL